MRKVISILACLIVLCILLGANLHVLGMSKVKATGNGWTLAVLSLLSFGPDSASPTGLSPAQIQSVYRLPSTGGTGTIAIIDAYDDPTVLNDANVFSNQYGLPTLNSDNFEKHIMGTTTVDGGWAEEISLDVQWAHALAPNAKILLVEAVDAGDGLFDAIDYARSRSDVIAISMSWGASEFSGETSYDFHFQPLGNAACAFFAASGDHCENVSYPASSPNVVSVGGTILGFNMDGSFANETVWYDGIVNGTPQGTGGGISQYETEPTFQSSYGVPGANGHRTVPDISFDAGSGVSVYDSTPGPAGQNWLSLGGTSLGAPAWAAIYSHSLTASNTILYARAKTATYSSHFRDITVGTNGLYSAMQGYDFVTGLGSPITATFDQPFASISPATLTMDVGQSHLFTSTVSGGIDPYSYQWYLNGIAVSGATGASWTFTPSSSGVHTVYVRATDAVGAVATSNAATVTVNPTLTNAVSPASFMMHVGQSQEFTSTISGGTSPYTYRWGYAFRYMEAYGVAALAEPSGPSYTFTPSTAGAYYLASIVTDSVNAAAGNIARVSVDVVPVVTISPSSVTIPVNQSQTFTSSVSNGFPPYTYQWYLNDTLVSDATSWTWTWTPSSTGSYTVYLKATDSMGNVGTSNTASIVVNPAPPPPPPGGGGCVLGSTRILMANGETIRVSQIRLGDQILGYDAGSGAFVTETVTSNNWTIVNQILSINGGRLLVTLTDQPVFTDHGWTENPEDLEVGWQIYEPMTDKWITINSLQTLNGYFQVYDLRATAPDTFIGNGILLDSKTP